MHGKLFFNELLRLGLHTVQDGVNTFIHETGAMIYFWLLKNPEERQSFLSSAQQLSNFTTNRTNKTDSLRIIIKKNVGKDKGYEKFRKLETGNRKNPMRSTFQFQKKL